jgi:hypothetical protein
MCPLSNNPKDHEHWVGAKNRLIRYYFYTNTGLNVFNNFKYLVGAILAIYWMLHLKNPIVLLVMFLISIPALGVIGYYSIHHINKVMDWLGVRFGTFYSLYSIKLQEEIRDAVKKLADSK